MVSAVLPLAVNLTSLTLDFLRFGSYLTFIASIVNTCDFPRLEVINFTVAIMKGTIPFLKRHRHTLKSVSLMPMIYFEPRDSLLDGIEGLEFPQLEILGSHTWVLQMWLNAFSMPRLTCLQPTWTYMDWNTIDDVIVTAQVRAKDALSSLKLGILRPGGLKAANIQLIALQLPNLTTLEIQLKIQMSSIEDMGLDMPALTSTRDSLLLLSKLQVFKWTAEFLPSGFGSELDLQNWTVAWLAILHPSLYLCQVPSGLVWQRVTQHVWFPEEPRDSDARVAFLWCFKHISSRTFPVMDELIELMTWYFLRHDSKLSSRVSSFLDRYAPFVEDDSLEVHDVTMDILSMVLLVRPIQYREVLQSPNYSRLRKIYPNE
ncbi:hypothetical protein VNI00_015692 [Paramarasmius palmivorus]|uniref:Uncharacterized protein n=1 Tax=Paramarasmius palmivorus TaxID=297713 RepID=A0AAW0BJH5_9AGAR